MNTIIIRALNSASSTALTASATASSTTSASKDTENSTLFKTIGIILALSSGVFIGSSFVFKKKGLLQAQGKVAGQGHAYLSNGLWWVGMILMIIGEICNFVAYAFTQAILVTPLGALSVVISAILSSIFLKETLNFQGKVGCALCIIGAIIIVMHAPSHQTASTIEEFRELFFHPIFLGYAIFCIVASAFIIWKLAPKYGSTNMLVYIGVCSLIGSLSVVSTQGLGTAILTTITDPSQNQLKEWFFYVLLGFVVVTLLTEINFLNKALNIFNTAMVTPLYYVIFTGLTILSSAILSQGFDAQPISIVTVVMGFLVICNGIILLFTSKGATIDIRNSIYSMPPEDIDPNDIDNNPGAMELRGSFGSVRRFSGHGRTHPSFNNTFPSHKDNGNNGKDGNRPHKRSQSLSANHRVSTGLPTINESALTLNTMNPHPDVDTTQTEINIAMEESFPSLARNSFVHFLPSHPPPPPSSDDGNTLPTHRKAPIIHTTSPSISSTNLNIDSQLPHNGNKIPSLPPVSPLQNIFRGLSPTEPDHHVTSESYSGTTPHVGRSISNSSRRSQQSVGLVDRIKLGISSPVGEQEENDFESLVGNDPNSEGAGNVI
ncbi:17580_t:CDS:2 [Acaulospora morrowiae]|uniref:17580_t:CDS:1 n=1 Tax=Acaulospora morrowiae TaxID=94023 RepID=A0A9N8YT83_9GLOM|nr:17580_t:CDS:2 [Acaulospora morrowiae]